MLFDIILCTTAQLHVMIQQLQFYLYTESVVWVHSRGREMVIRVEIRNKIRCLFYSMIIIINI